MSVVQRSNEPGTNGKIPQVDITGLAAIILSISFVETILAVTAIVLRVYASRIGAGRLRWDFCFVVGATVLGIVTEALFVMACKYGVGKHVHTISFDQLWVALKFSWIGIFTGLMGTLVGKSAIVALLYQVATPTQPRRKILLLGIGTFNALIGLIQLVLSVSQCSPYQKLWYMLIPGNCKRTRVAFTFGYVQGTTAILTDFALALYPISIVWNLQASMKTKVGFCVLMAGGVICAIAAIMRTHYTTVLSHPIDPTYDLVTFLAWASTELWFVTIIACIPPLRPLFLRWLDHTKSLVSKSSKSATRSGTGHDTPIPLPTIPAPCLIKPGASSRVTPSESGSEENILLHPREQDRHIVVTQSYCTHFEV